MKYLKRYLILLMFFPMIIIGQDNNMNQSISEYLDYNRTMAQYEFAYDQLMKMMGGTYPKDAKNEQQWTFLENNKEKAVSEMKEHLIIVYQKHFTHDDIKKMSAYYKSESGRLLVTDRSKMTEEHKKELNSFYNSAVGQKIMTKQELLTQDISKISESWSRDLYETSVSVLSNG